MTDTTTRRDEFYIEERSGINVLVYKSGGCRPSSDAEDALYSEVAELRRQVEVMRAGLNAIVTHFNHPYHDHNWAYYATELAHKALAECGKGDVTG